MLPSGIETVFIFGEGGGEYVYNFEIFTVDFVLDNMFNILAGPATASR